MKSMKESANAVNNEDIIDFAFNPEASKRVETLGGMIGETNSIEQPNQITS